MNIKTIAGLVLGGYVGWKVGERVSSGPVAEFGGAAVGAAVGYWVSKKV